jgi:hypothetical protein
MLRNTIVCLFTFSKQMFIRDHSYYTTTNRYSFLIIYLPVHIINSSFIQHVDLSNNPYLVFFSIFFYSFISRQEKHVNDVIDVKSFT